MATDEPAETLAGLGEFAVIDRLVTGLGAQHIGEVCRLFLENASVEVDAVRQALEELLL